MKPLYPRPAQIPANYVFIGQGGTFEPEFGESYSCVSPRWRSKSRFYSQRSEYAARFANIDYYVVKDGPTYLKNQPKKEPKMKQMFVTEKRPLVAGDIITLYVYSDGASGTRSIQGSDNYPNGTSNKAIQLST
jgi:hypothetical protein